MSLPVGYALAGANGITIFAVRSDKGRVIVNGDKWREPFSFGRIFTIFAREGVGNPAQDLEEQKEKPCVAATHGDPPRRRSSSVPIDGVAVFLNQEMQLELSNPIGTGLARRPGEGLPARAAPKRSSCQMPRSAR